MNTKNWTPLDANPLPLQRKTVGSLERVKLPSRQNLMRVG